MEAEAEPSPREGAPGVAALLALPAGTVVCFVDAAGPLAVVRCDKARWVLRPVAELSASSGPGARRRTRTRLMPRCVHAARLQPSRPVRIRQQQC